MSKPMTVNDLKEILNKCPEDEQIKFLISVKSYNTPFPVYDEIVADFIKHENIVYTETPCGPSNCLKFILKKKE